MTGLSKLSRRTRSDLENSPVSVLLLIYNRPQETERVLQAVRKARPNRLFVSGDGPKDNGVDFDLVKLTRSLISEFDWPCQIETRYLDENLGCRQAVTSGLDWFFGQVDEGIVLEDDTLPSKSFFNYAANLLKKYRTDTRIMKISGHNALRPRYSWPNSYFFSHVSFSWGWASWSRAWEKNQPEMASWVSLDSLGLLRSPQVDWYSRRVMRKKANLEGTWDYQWDFSIASNNGLHIVPSQNLIQNIGFGPSATHTTGETPGSLNPKLEEMQFPLVHPQDGVLPNRKFQNALRKQQVISKISRKLWA